MNTHLQTTTTLLVLAAIVAGLYFFTAITLFLFILTIVYAVIYTEIKESKENKNEEKTTRENN
jgi:hypothetical protein